MVVTACQQATPRLQAMMASPSASSRQAAAVAAGNLACHGHDTQQALAAAGRSQSLCTSVMLLMQVLGK